MKASSSSKLSLGISLIILGAVLLVGSKQANYSLSNSFEDEPVKVVNLSAEEVDSRLLPRRVIVPELGIDLAVKKSGIVNGNWQVFDDTAAWGAGSGVPGRAGNQVIFAHAREGLFLPLKKARVGQTVYVFTQDYWYQYQIVGIKEVYPNQTEVIEQGEEEELTLYTCSGFADQKRLIVSAKRSDL